MSIFSLQIFFFWISQILDTSYQFLWILCMKYYSTFSGPFCLRTISRSTERTFWLLRVWSKLYPSFSWLQVRWQLVLLSPYGFVDKSWFGFQSTTWNWRFHSFYVFLHVHISNMSFLYINMHVVAEYLLFHEVHVVFKYDKQRRLM